MNYDTIQTFLVIISLITYGIAIIRGIQYAIHQRRVGIPVPGWVTLGGAFAGIICIFLLYATVNRLRGYGPSHTVTTASLLVYFIGAIIMNGLITVLDRGNGR